MPGGRPRSTRTCPYCGALPSHQRPERVQAVPDTPEPPPAVLEAPRRFHSEPALRAAPDVEPTARYMIARVTLPDGRVRTLYMYDPANARAAAAALARDPSLLATIMVDEYEDA